MNPSKYNSPPKNPKITYLLGAGASYNSVPIWAQQAETMQQIAGNILSQINPPEDSTIPDEYGLLNDEILIDFFNKMLEFSNKAVEFGSIDIYARRLSLLKRYSELNDLKFCLSIYFDLWELFSFKNYKIGNTQLNFSQIDKRYYSLLSILLEPKNDFTPKIPDNVKFCTWNYDLQLELAFSSFLDTLTNNLITINKKFPFSEQINKHNLGEEIENIVHHFNGHRGIFISDDKAYENIDGSHKDDFWKYLKRLKSNFSQFRDINYRSCIKYSWEEDEIQKDKWKNIFRNTDILIIIGYSFPAFNRRIDAELFKSLSNVYQIVYQDPNASINMIKTLNQNIQDDKIKILNNLTDLKNFYIPNEYLFPIEDSEIHF
ncbi:MAG: hypothetical protein CL524_14185 [Aequorivita sp.]|nr:hypothetical protein [Aequorivita sp.]MBF30889.1 hypothetical protein [Aequorivita sp.]|tara:strand:+ start:74910 stop:76031 length:1122 start_codon:yes stop_codon:yes gene_type:complete